MASCAEFDSLDDEVKELLLNYKHKKATSYEPCTLKNYKECLLGLHEEFGLLNVNYLFNPYLDIENNSLTTESLCKLINGTWTLLQYYKNLSDKAEKLVEHNHVLEHTNKQLNVLVGNLKNKLNGEKNEVRACIASAQRVSDQSEEVCHNLAQTRSKLTQITKQKETCERSLRNEITRLKLENSKLSDRLRNKSGTYTSCSEVCDSTLLQLKERERKQRAVIGQLQTNNRELLKEVLAMKEEIILGGLHDFQLNARK